MFVQKSNGFLQQNRNFKIGDGGVTLEICAFFIELNPVSIVAKLVEVVHNLAQPGLFARQGHKWNLYGKWHFEITTIFFCLGPS